MHNMTGLLICAAVAALMVGFTALGLFLPALMMGDLPIAIISGPTGLALIAVALWLAYAAGGA